MRLKSVMKTIDQHRSYNRTLPLTVNVPVADSLDVVPFFRHSARASWNDFALLASSYDPFSRETASAFCSPIDGSTMEVVGAGLCGDIHFICNIEHYIILFTDQETVINKKNTIPYTLLHLACYYDLHKVITIRTLDYLDTIFF